ncbi:MAG: aminomethyltransferase family protein, partial [Anaerolineales bacterium]|nr:aminomethyltransferase family protein [Anaerolineales bacterium]
YSPWCDENGDMIHDGNTVRIAEDHFRLTAADPTLVWLEDCAYGLDVAITDVTTRYAALALQGPKSRIILAQVLEDMDIEALKYFRMAQGRIGTAEVMVTRTGFTGDLGYELWCASAHAEPIWDTLMTAGAPYGILPMGLHVLDMLRVEAGLLLIEVDYISARYAVIDGQKSNPLEAGLEWAVKFDRDEKFVGYDALLKDQEQGPEWQLVGLVVEWTELERLWGAVDLRPTVVDKGTSREAVPVYKEGVQIGQATSHLYSPLLKQYIALATLKTEHAQLGRHVELEMTVEYSRHLATAEIVSLPFYNPERKRK